MNHVLRVALAQINPIVGDLAGNREKILSFLEQASQRQADLVVFPELAISGYPPEDLLLKPRFLRDCREALEQVARYTTGIVAVVGFPDVNDRGVYNAAALIADGRILDVYHKIELPNYGVFDEKRYFISGSGHLIFEIGGIHTSVTICEDIWAKNGTVERHTLKNRVPLVLNLSASPFHAGKTSLRYQVIAGFAKRTCALVCYTNQVGGQDELVFDGGSEVVGPDGEVISCAKLFEEDLLVTDVELPAGEQETLSRDTSGRWSRCIALKSVAYPLRSPISRSKAPDLGKVQEVYKALVLGIMDYAGKNGFQKAVVGLSGGIDSSLTAAISVDALGESNVIGVTMPSRYTSVETKADAVKVAEHLKISLITIPIWSVYLSHLEALEEVFGQGKQGIEFENLQARIRGNILMALSNRFGWLVLTTGNKSEIAVGYCTLYGDTAGGFAVIKDVPKTLVYELTEYINREAGREVIPRSVIERPPSAELKPDQKDQDFLPPYDVLDHILQAYVEEDCAPDEIIGPGFDAAVVNRIVRLVDKSEYKRRQAPPGVKITPKAFGRDRRLPITNQYTSSVKGE